MDTRRGIATDSGIPWELPGDTAHFHHKTATGVILMRWATYNEFAAPLRLRIARKPVRRGANGYVVHETQYFASAFGAPEWRTALAEPMPGRDITRA